ncbi:hypothetical protein FISHEDRAFT_74313 [Fistulina hepatica ATCC 64428]|uniref:ER-bound oxygenase mpaB/mpaB'/Rubber oxygenase catalytic domain-containing protein n=1 Tax=Fistulina hepatica ATCC 64428 TaxID=1128425 RepID=A0A0D7AAB5_9AGAR|nr:hypothetical protein FISHEDRAFT_74313 [Fistulina hepatica ATCC 64428]
MPTLITLASAYGLIKTYGIPSVAKVIRSTRQMISPATTARRLIDTEIMILTLLSFPISGAYPSQPLSPDEEPDKRAALALARMNFFHTKYKVNTDEMAYNHQRMALQIWAERWGWRKFSPLEKHATFLLWREFAVRMGIPNMPTDYDEFRAWCMEHEIAHMHPARANNAVASPVLAEFVSPFPTKLGIRALARGLFISAMDERCREALMFPAQPWYVHALLDGTMTVLGWWHRHLSLPRSQAASLLDLSSPHSISGTTQVDMRAAPATAWFTVASRLSSRPWYKPESHSMLGHAKDRLLVLAGWLTDMPGPQYKSGGYRLVSLTCLLAIIVTYRQHTKGPDRFEDEGHDTVIREANDMLATARCPVTGKRNIGDRNAACPVAGKA